MDSLAPLVGLGVIGGILAGGRIGDRLAGRRGGAQRLAVASVCDLLAAAILLCALLSSSVIAAGLLLFVAAGLLGGAGPCLDAVRVDIVTPQVRGRAEAARSLLTLASTALGPVTFGLVAGALARGERHGAGLRDAFLIMLVPLAASGLILLVGLRRYATDAAAAGTPRLDPPGGEGSH